MCFIQATHRFSSPGDLVNLHQWPSNRFSVWLTWASVGAEPWSGCCGWADDALMVTFLSERLLLSRLCDLCRSLLLRSLHERDTHSDGGEGNAVAMVMGAGKHTQTNDRITTIIILPPHPLADMHWLPLALSRTCPGWSICCKLG